MLRKLLTAILSIPLLLLLYIGFLHLLPDEGLTPETTSWLATKRTNVPIAQNSYYLIWGLEAPAGVSMREYGEARVDKINHLSSKFPQYDSDGNETYLPDGVEHSKRIKATGLAELCKPSNKNCLHEYHSTQQERLAQGDNALLLERYRELSNLPHYRNVESFGIYTPFPDFHLLISAQRLRHVAIASQYIDGPKNTALAELASDLRFSRMLMAEAETLLERLIAMRMVVNNLHTYSQLLESIDTNNVALAVSNITPLTKQERNLDGVFRGELRFQKSIIESMEDASPEIDTTGWEIIRSGLLPLRMNHMLNISQAHLEINTGLSQLPPSLFKARHKESSSELHMNPGIWNYLYDPVNTLLLDSIPPDYSSYVLRHYDLDGLIRLVKLKGMLITKSVPTEEIESFIAQSPFASAYSQEMAPIRWYPDENTLSYTPVDNDHSDDFSQVYFGKAADR